MSKCSIKSQKERDKDRGKKSIQWGFSNWLHISFHYQTHSHRTTLHFLSCNHPVSPSITQYHPVSPSITQYYPVIIIAMTTAYILHLCLWPVTKKIIDMNFGHHYVSVHARPGQTFPHSSMLHTYSKHARPSRYEYAIEINLYCLEAALTYTLLTQWHNNKYLMLRTRT